MDLLISYDLDSNWVKVKKEMLDLGYKDTFTYGENPKKRFYLPNTTLWKKNTSDCSKAIDDLNNIAASLGTKVERAIAIPWGDEWVAIQGDPHKR